MSDLRVRAYNVRFGDALLVSVPEKNGRREVTRHILIDVGNVLSGKGGDNAVFEPVVQDIQKVLGGEPVDLYVMTHEHMDHVKGLQFAEEQLKVKLKARYAWITASAAPNYYNTHSEAKKKRATLVKAFDQIKAYLGAAPHALSPWAQALLANNDYRDTEKCVAHLRKVAPAANTTYVHRRCKLAGTHPFTEAKIKVWAPEEDTSDYYGRFQPMALGLDLPLAGAVGAAPVTPTPPPGIDAGAFFDLLAARRRGWSDNLLAIDQAKNNTSVVFCIEWRGWRLLFPGDAEQRSWKTMAKHGVLKPVHFLKVAHHGSHNGTPPMDLLDQILPIPATDEHPRHAVICTCAGCYNGVPHGPTLGELEKRCEVHTVENVPEGGYLDFYLTDRIPYRIREAGAGSRTHYETPDAKK